ncbi:hypothetical protein FQV27_08245 [Paracoccus aurantiacus]|uniref:Uncharacterized protein n=1 Tax=Paracoccus aurantiacus TaxID=2599412 RepID=A0A5C6S6M5_9RHOB|nr:hypothetical protein [Paracoccus aurantiacus]TXB70075.1 hypothetical protein FQV27_08245 [Paracoccus aurantiacus]
MNFDLSKPKNYRLLDGKTGLVGNIVETALSGSATAVLAAAFFKPGDLTWWGPLDIIVGIVFTLLTAFLGVRQLEQYNYLFGNPGVHGEEQAKVSNTGLVPFVRAAIAVLASVTYFGVAGCAIYVLVNS